MRAHVLDLRFELQLGAFSSTLERHVLKEVSDAVVCLSLLLLPVSIQTPTVAVSPPVVSEATLNSLGRVETAVGA